MAQLEIGSRRLVNCYDGSGHNAWIPATLEWWDEPNYAVFALDHPDHQGRIHCAIPLPNGRHRLKEEPHNV